MKMTNLCQMMILSLLTANFAFAQSAQQTAPQPRASDKVDLKKLEDKYWSAKDDDYGVIQNRTFSKSGRVYLSAAYGTLINDPFAKTSMAGLFAGYYFSEDFGIEGYYFNANSKANDSVKEFNSLSTAGTSPNYTLPGNAYNVALTYTPFYAKMAFMNKAILYFDMGFTLGAGVSEYSQVVAKKEGGVIVGEEKIKQTSPHAEIGVMQQLFINRNWAFRLDIKNKFHNTETVPYNRTGIGAQSKDGEKKMSYDTMMSLGVTFFLN